MKPMSAALCACVLLAGCAGGMVRRVSEPAASIQQLGVAADGRWTVQLRLNNFSSIPMRFDVVRLDLAVAGQPAGTLQAQPALSIGPESADVVTVSLLPAAATRIVVADALASGRGIRYSLKGSVTATPEDKRARTFDIESESALSPVPGLAGVMR